MKTTNRRGHIKFTQNMKNKGIKFQLPSPILKGLPPPKGRETSQNKANPWRKGRRERNKIRLSETRGPPTTPTSITRDRAGPRFSQSLKILKGKKRILKGFTMPQETPHTPQRPDLNHLQGSTTMTPSIATSAPSDRPAASLPHATDYTTAARSYYKSRDVLGHRHFNKINIIFEMIALKACRF